MQVFTLDQKACSEARQLTGLQAFGGLRAIAHRRSQITLLDCWGCTRAFSSENLARSIQLAGLFSLKRARLFYGSTS